MRALELGGVREKLLSSGIDADGSTPARLAAAVKSEIVILGKLIKDLNIHE